MENSRGHTKKNKEPAHPPARGFQKSGGHFSEKKKAPAATYPQVRGFQKHGGHVSEKISSACGNVLTNWGLTRSQRITIFKLKIRVAQNVGKVWISRKRNLLAQFGAIWGKFFHGPNKCKKHRDCLPHRWGWVVG